jgi:dipeptidase D
MDANIEFDYLTGEMPADHIAFEIKITGLKGGHSGLDINLGRGNSNIILSRLLRKGELAVHLRLCEFEGGNMRNAIPREAHATVLVPRSRKDDFGKLIAVYSEVISKELSGVEPDLKIVIRETSTPSRVMDPELQRRVIASIYSCPNGVVRMTDGIPGLVETSTNLSIVKTSADKIQINCLLRSSVDSAKENLSEVLKALFDLAGARSVFTGSYPGWKPNMNSSIMKLMDEVYQKMYNKKMEIKAVHAGLECGIIGGVYPDLDMVSFGPTIRHPHSPDEKVNIPSVQKFWDFLVKTMESIPE